MSSLKTLQSVCKCIQITICCLCFFQIQDIARPVFCSTFSGQVQISLIFQLFNTKGPVDRSA